jgi:hypothetical protein
MSRRAFWGERPCILALLLASCALAQEHSATGHPSILRGSWIATAGPRSFRGRWSGQLLPNTFNVANGSWTLLSDSNQILLEGTWSAQRTLRTWRGTWSARIATGRSFSGSWTADVTDPSNKTFGDMLNSTLEKQVSGSWRSGRMQGNWWLQGSRY